MANNNDGVQENAFENCLNVLKETLNYVEDTTFSWKDVVSILVIKLSNTDSINKANEASNATQIQLTSERDASAGQRKTEDFFPTLTLNTTFKGWRIEIPVHLSKKNLSVLMGEESSVTEGWHLDHVQIRRRILNADAQGNGNPTLQICYGLDIMPLRKALNVEDYIVFAKRRDAESYEAFGVLKDIDLGKDKKMYVSDKADKDKTRFSITDITNESLRFKTDVHAKFSRNRILFGAPGTGKSYTINKERKEMLGEDNELDYERVTFHPDYSYANFVGTYKPVPCKDSDGKDAITYEYVPGPFMRVFVKALKNGRTNNVKPYLLIIEEINRANVAAVFGDVFQLLDRDKHEVSEYSIQASEDIKKFLAKPENLGGNPEDYQKIRIPDNMFIWATMNSADQGVFPMDTAFKRRWDFKYLGIDDSDAEVQGKTVVLGTKVSQRVEWNKLRKAINKFLAAQKINEDKQLGPYFMAKRIVVPENGDEIDSKKFIETFKNKVIMYLFEDAAKQKRATLFEGCFQNSSRYSEICKEFEEKGIGIFNSEIQIAAEPEDLPSTEATNESAMEDTNK